MSLLMSSLGAAAPFAEALLAGTEPGRNLQPRDVTPGLVGFLVTAGVVLAAIPLFLSMTSRLRRVRHAERTAATAGGQAGADGADGATGTVGANGAPAASDDAVDGPAGRTPPEGPGTTRDGGGRG